MILHLLNAIFFYMLALGYNLSSNLQSNYHFLRVEHDNKKFFQVFMRNLSILTKKFISSFFQLLKLIQANLG